MNETVRGLSEGKVVYTDQDLDVTELDWHPHASFTGVFLKHLVRGDSSDGKFSCHLIRIKDGFEIGEHVHDGKWEFINIVGGVGKGEIAGKKFTCELGVSLVVPENVNHRIVADSGDVYLLAKFIPALL
ncbi:MAG: AraC family ligand binding domain-containing protein [Desulfotomaculaceae bacterium]|nr:AraC family ligand binding domain-containing protein [Desulfotomaculaceae bacterium]